MNLSPQNRERLADCFVKRGFATADALAKADMLVRCGQMLRDAGGGARGATRAYFVPGRIEVLGKHTDYAGGRSLLAAASKGICVAAVARADRTVRVVSTLGGRRYFQLGETVCAPGDWAAYPMAVAARLASNFPQLVRGADIAIASDLPPASGMSSSSALVVACFLALVGREDACGNEPLHRSLTLSADPAFAAEITSLESLAGYLGAVENGSSFGSLAGERGVGTFGGSEDHTAMLCCRAGQLSQYSFCPVRFERSVAMPRGYVLAVASSGVVAAKTGEAMEHYNRVSLRARAVLEVWREKTGRDDATLAGAVHAMPNAAGMIREFLAASRHERFDARSLLARFEQFVAESEQIIPEFTAALSAGDMLAAGRLADESQALAQRCLENQTPETTMLAASARQLGAAAASAFGAGFGGSVYAMVQAGTAGDFLREWSRRYAAEFPARADVAAFFLTAPGSAAFAVEG